MVGILIVMIGVLVIVFGTSLIGLAPALVVGIIIGLVGLLYSWEELS